MRTLIAVVLALATLNMALATEIEITSEDCNFEVRKEKDEVILRVSKIIAIENSISAWDIELPHDEITLPLKEGLKTKMKNPFGEEIIISYKNGILTHDHKATANFTRDTLEMKISPDLQKITSAKFVRKGTGILVFMSKEKFECKF